MFINKNWLSNFFKYLVIIISISAFIVGLYSYPNLILAQSNGNPPRVRYKPNSRGTPPAKNATGSRGDCPKTNIPLLGLGGQVGYTQTVSEYPIFWVYIPYTIHEVYQGEFELQENNGKTIDEVSVSLPTTPGIISIRLNQPLSLNQKYRWYLEINCRIDLSSSQKTFVTGLVERIMFSDEFNRQLKIAQTPLERILIYAENGIWYDTLTELLTQPSLQTIKNDFFKKVGLEDISHVPLLLTN